MNDDQRHARIFGVLFIITFITSIAALALFQPVLDDPVGYIAGGGKDNQIYLGAFLELLLVISNVGTAVVLYPIAMFKWPWQLGELDWGAFWVGMIGLFLLSATGVAVGLMYSSFTESQILSFFATMLTLTGIYALGTLSAVESLQGGIGDAISFISLQSRFEPFARGLLDTRAIVYFVSLAALCLAVAFHALERRKWT